MKKIFLVLPVILLFSCAMAKEHGTISVSGSGTVMAAPDTAQLAVSVSEMAKTTKEAQILANGKISLVTETLKSAGIKMKNITTSAIRFSNDYIWNDQTRRNEIVGQIVSQSVMVKFEDLNDSPDLLASVLDSLGMIDGIEISNLMFSIADPREYYIEARRLAYEKAEQKGEELASYADLKLGRALNINETGTGSLPYGGYGMVQRNAAVMEYEGSVPSEIPGGEISITYDISVVFETN
ncbi:MAG: SIMPL domain-containing protein [Spirochaetales bacterium]|nr:SIMPL domain-containing protein [Spirochaetales bacterium]